MSSQSLTQNGEIRVRSDVTGRHTCTESQYMAEVTFWSARPRYQVTKTATTRSSNNQHIKKIPSLKLRSPKLSVK